MDLDAGSKGFGIMLFACVLRRSRPACATDPAAYFRLRRDIDRLGLPKGLTLHGLRKSLGGYLAEAEASTRQLMDVLGHDDIDHAELYSREASQVRLAVQGMDRVVRLVTRRPAMTILHGPAVWSRCRC
jgi:integrase